MGSKDAPQKMQLLVGCNKKSGKSGRSTPKRKSGGKPPQIRPPPKQNRSEPQCFCIFQEPMNRGKYAFMGLWVKYALGKSSCLSKVTPVVQKNRRITLSVFLSTLQSTALLLKRFRLRFHCYTLENMPEYEEYAKKTHMSHINGSHPKWILPLLRNARLIRRMRRKRDLYYF